MSETRKLVDAVVDGIREKKGQQIVVADLQGIDGAIAKYFVICQGGSPQQVEAIADSIADTTREQLHEKPVRTVGLEQALWVAMDYGDVMVHVFVPDMRGYYDLEHLWEDAQMERLPEAE